MLRRRGICSFLTISQPPSSSSSLLLLQFATQNGFHNPTRNSGGEGISSANSLTSPSCHIATVVFPTVTRSQKNQREVEGQSSGIMCALSSHRRRHIIPPPRMCYSIRSTASSFGGASTKNKRSSSSSSLHSTSATFAHSDRIPKLIHQGTHEFAWKDASISGVAPTVAKIRVPVETTPTRSIIYKIKQWAMPRGYPYTVAPGFQKFFMLTALNFMFASFALQVATRSLLSGFFTESSAGTWMLKDLVPTLFSALIANFIVSYENRAKYWFVVAASLAATGAVLEMCIPFVVPAKYFLLAAATTSLMKGSAGLMYGITRATFFQHFAIAQNMGELTKKLNSVGAVIFTSFGAFGLVFSTICPQFWVQMTAVISCCMASIYVSYISVQTVEFRVLTPTNITVIIDEFIQSGYDRVPTPASVSTQLGVKGYLRDPPRNRHFLLVGPRITSLEMTDDSFSEALALFSPLSCKFTIGIWEEKKSGWRKKKPKKNKKKQQKSKEVQEEDHSDLRLVLLLHKDCELKHLLTGLLICHAALEAMTKESAADPSSNTKEKKSPLPSNPHIVREVLNDFLLNQGSRVIKEWSQRAELLLLQMKTSGWETNSHALDMPSRRIAVEWDEATFRNMDDNDGDDLD